MESVYQNKTYQKLNPSWHEEDSTWKAAQVLLILRKHQLQIHSVAEIGCGSGAMLCQLHQELPVEWDFHGFDIAPDAIATARKREGDRLQFHQEDLLASPDKFDLLLVIDVVEHVPDYLGFLEKCRLKAKYKLYHLPLDLHVSSVARASLMDARRKVCHLHYFSAETAVASLVDTGHRVLDIAYTDGALALSHTQPRLQRSLANILRWLVSLVSKPLAARLLGGYSLLVLTE